MSELTPKQQEIATWSNALNWAMEQASIDLEYDIPIDMLLANPESLDESQRDFVKQFEITTYEYAIAQWSEKIEQCRQILGAIIERRERRALEWLQLENYQDVEQAARALIDIPDSSAGRQIESFLTNHLPVLDRAGVAPQETSQLIAKTDRLIMDTSRAISRIEKSDLTETEKDGKIRELIDDAVSAPYASSVRKKWLNGKVKLARDIFWCEDGTRLVTFICENDDEFLELDKHTSNIVAEHGNTQRILDETRDERMIIELKKALAIIQSGSDDLSTVDRSIAEIVTEYLKG